MQSSGSTGQDPLNPQELLELARRRVRDGTLGREPQPRLFAGQGRQEQCSLCGEAIGVGEIEYEVESVGAGPAVRQMRFHRPCYYAWLQACSSELQAEPR